MTGLLYFGFGFIGVMIILVVDVLRDIHNELKRIATLEEDKWKEWKM